MSAEVEVKIFGQTYKVKGDDPERINRAAEFVDGMMADLLGGPEQGLSARGAVFTALNMAEEWFSQKDELQRIIFDLGERVDELLNLLPE